jgi:uncharacterized damage-inducible protein DinB
MESTVSRRLQTMRAKLATVTYYGSKELAASFRTVRKNTLTIADEIPEEQYGYRPFEGARTIAEMLTHIAFGASFAERVNLVERRSSMEGFDFLKFRSERMAGSAKPRAKSEIIALLKEQGEKYAKAVESLSDDFLGESVAMPPGGTPPSRTRFDMFLAVKEHEMHHRAQLMLIERMLGITPHLTRENDARIAAMQAARK